MKQSSDGLPALFPTSRKVRLLAAGAMAVLLALFIVRLCVSIPGNSVTYDESVHVTRGYAVDRFRDLRLNIEHPMLGDALAALPLLFRGSIRFPEESEAWRSASHWVIADQFLWHTNHNPQHLVDLARGSVAGMSVLLGLLVVIWAAELYGWKGALFSLLLYTLSPTVIANSILATNDLSVALFSTLYLWTLWRFVRRPSWALGGACAVALAAALMCKYSAMVLGIDTLVLMAWWWFRTGSAAGLRPGRRLSYEVDGEAGAIGIDALRRHAPAGAVLTVLMQAIAIFVGAGIVIWLAYGAKLNPLATPAVMQQEVGQSLDQFIRGVSLRPDTRLLMYPEEAEKAVPPEPHNLRWRLLRHVPVPAPQYVRGFLQNWMQARGGHRAYLMGRVSRTGWWYYFPVAFLVKTPIPFLILIALALASIYFRWEWDEWFLLIPAFLLCLIAMKAHIDIGLRHLLPAYPLLAIFCGRLIETVCRFPTEGRPPPRLAGAAVLAVLCLWFGVEGARVHPLYLTYFNQFAGGPSGGSRFLVDSNLDWGQDLIRLHCELQRRGIHTIGLAYFGTAEPQAYGIVNQPLDPEPAHSLKKGLLPLYGWVAVSVSELAYFGGHGEGLAWLAPYRPAFTVGHSIQVYHIPVPHVKQHEIRKLMHADQIME